MLGGGENSSVSVFDLSQERLTLITPTIVCVSVFMVVGLIGNFFVVAVFGFRNKKRSTYRYFILTLAMYDLTACSVGMPGLLAEMSQPFVFYSGVWCKILRYGFHVIAGGSSLTHILVCIDRYYRICKATSKQISLRKAKTLCLSAFIFALIAAMPVFIMYDSIVLEIGLYNVTGHICDVSTNYTDTVFPVFFNGLLSFLLTVSIMIMVMLYSCIGHRLCLRQRTVMPLMPVDQGSETRHSTMDSKTPRWSLLKRKHKTIRYPIAEPDKDFESVSVINTAEVAKVPQTIASLRARQKHSREVISRKMTITTFAIMVVFVVSFVPLEILELETLLSKNIENGMTNLQLIFYHLGYHTYVINNAANPLVYIFMDNEFRRQCIEILSYLKCKRRIK